MRSPIIRRSSSICASPGPPRVPMPPRWRSRWLQRPTRRVAMYCSRASSTCSLPSWLCARSAKMSRIKPVRSATGTPRWRSRLRCCAGLKAWSKITPCADVAATSALISSALPLPMKSAGSGALRRAVTRPTAMSPADAASSASSSSVGSKCAPEPMLTPTSTARVSASASECFDSGAPADGRGGASPRPAPGGGVELKGRSSSAAVDAAAAGAAPAVQAGSPGSLAWKLTARLGTTVEIACL